MADKNSKKKSWKSVLFAHEEVDIFRDTPIRYLGEIFMIYLLCPRANLICFGCNMSIADSDECLFHMASEQ